LGEEIAMSFATGALITGIALITTGFAEGIRGTIAYFQEAIIVQMAGMGAGPAALAWLNDKPDFVFFGLTILYSIIMLGYLFYTVREQNGSSPLVNCFLDQVPSMYGKTAMKIANGTITGIALGLILIAILVRYYFNRWKHRPRERQRHVFIIRTYKWVFVVIVFVAETVLAVVVQYTLSAYSNLVSDSDREVLGSWDFGQIIPLVMLLGPLMDVVRAVKENMEERRKRKAEGKEERTEHAEVKGLEAPAVVDKIADEKLSEMREESTVDGSRHVEVLSKSAEVSEITTSTIE
jgi:hypothetical protein